MELPICPKCSKIQLKPYNQKAPPVEAIAFTLHKMVPLSDFGPDGGSVVYKAWVCINPACGYAIRIDKGVVGREITFEEEKK